MKIAPLRSVLIVLIAISGCMSEKPTGGTVDSGFGERESDGSDGRSTVVITSVPDASDYVLGAAPYESAEIRIGSVTDGMAPVELLVKGAFPDSCTELHGANQTRTGSQVIVQIQTRRPANAMCASVMRPYRFYLTIEGAFEPGRYTLDLNDRTQDFNVN